MRTAVITPPFAIDLVATLAPLQRGRGDPTTRVERGLVWRALRTPDGPATLGLRQESPTRIVAESWGPGADRAVEDAPAIVGTNDDDEAFVPHHDIVGELWKRHRGVRITTAGSVLPILLAAILEQKVTGVEARRAWRLMVREVREAAPAAGGTAPPDLLLPPDPGRLAALPYFAFHRFGVERRRAEVIRAVCADADRIEDLGALPLPEAHDRLARIRGVGPWTAAEVARLALGDPDAVSVGDLHLPHTVAWALAGEPRATDERMLELLEPYRGQRGRVQRLLEAGHINAPRFGPRADVRSIERI